MDLGGDQCLPGDCDLCAILLFSTVRSTQYPAALSALGVRISRLFEPLLLQLKARKAVLMSV